MKKVLVSLLITASFLSCKNDKKSKENINTESEIVMSTENVYQFKVQDVHGDEFDFASLQGNKIMIVNTASLCGNTPQYEQLQALYETYGGNGFTIIGFPANNFGKQEPGTDGEIAAFCKEKYQVTFPMMSKVSVKGDDIHELYQFLTEKSRNGLQDSNVGWNFQKYLLNENGELVKVIEPKMLPDDVSIVDWIKS